MPNTKITVTAISNPSGTAATARMMDTRTISSSGRPESSPVAKIASVTAMTSLVRVLLKVRRRRCKGVSSWRCSCRLAAIWPSSVLAPVRPTRITPRPVSTVVPIKILQCSGSADLLIGSLSPVRMASSTAMRALSRISPSAGAFSPALRSTISSGTSSRVSTSTRLPSRNTVVVGLSRPLSDS